MSGLFQIFAYIKAVPKHIPKSVSNYLIEHCQTFEHNFRTFPKHLQDNPRTIPQAHNIWKNISVTPPPHPLAEDPPLPIENHYIIRPWRVGGGVRNVAWTPCEPSVVRLSGARSAPREIPGAFGVPSLTISAAVGARSAPANRANPAARVPRDGVYMPRASQASPEGPSGSQKIRRGFQRCPDNPASRCAAPPPQLAILTWSRKSPGL